MQKSTADSLNNIHQEPLTKPKNLANELHRWFIVAKFCIGSATLFGWADNKRIVHQYVTNIILNNTPQALNSKFFLLLDWLPYQI